MNSLFRNAIGRGLAALLLLPLLTAPASAGGDASRLDRLYALIANPDMAQEDWVSLFNGRNLDGWTPKIRGYPAGENFGDTFHVADGALSVSYAAYDEFDHRFGHIFYNTPYSHYILALEYRFQGEQAKGAPGWALENSGVMAHSPSAENMGLMQDFPTSIEVQLLGSGGQAQRPTGNLCTPGTHVHMNGNLIEQHCVNSSSKTYPGEQWVTLDLLVLGNEHMEHFINGTSVLSYTEPRIGGGMVSGFLPEYKQDGTAVSGGYFSLQAEGHPVQFRNIRLLNLAGCTQEESSNYRDYLVEHIEESCRP